MDPAVLKLNSIIAKLSTMAGLCQACHRCSTNNAKEKMAHEVKLGIDDIIRELDTLHLTEEIGETCYENVINLLDDWKIQCLLCERKKAVLLEAYLAHREDCEKAKVSKEKRGSFKKRKINRVARMSDYRNR